PRSAPSVLSRFVPAAAGAVYAWAARHEMTPDGMSYLDVASAFMRGDWRMALNRQWSPLYPALMALTLRVVRPAPYDEFATVQVLNYVIFLGALVSFDFL